MVQMMKLHPQGSNKQRFFYADFYLDNDNLKHINVGDEFFSPEVISFDSYNSRQMSLGHSQTIVEKIVYSQN